MKNINFFLFVLFALITSIPFTSCSKEDEPTGEKPSSEQTISAPTITISTPDPIISAEEGNTSISFNASTDWTALSNVDWITLSSTNGKSGSATITATVKANETYDQRNGLITIKCGTVTKSISITQLQKDAIILAKNEYDISSEGGALDFDIQTNIDFTIEISDSWIKQVSTRALETKTLLFDIAKNEGETRKGTITISHNGIKQVVSINQEGMYTQYLQFFAESEQTLSLTLDIPTLEYSINGKEWKSLGLNTVSFGGTKGVLYIRGKSTSGTAKTERYYYDEYASFRFGNKTKVQCSGDIRSLIDYENYKNVNTSFSRFGFLFEGCDVLTSAPELPATELASNCYKDMFKNCTSLVNAPALPSTKLTNGCYYEMFFNCTSLTNSPELPATNLADNCYFGMFSGTNVLPDVSKIDFNSNIAPHGLQGLFKGTIISDDDLKSMLPADKNGMSYLPFKTLFANCYDSMFMWCHNLKSAPKLPATTLEERCYVNMFYDCTILENAPELPATELTVDCYLNMFSGCLSLKKAPELPATTLADGCYYNMFGNCILLEEAPNLPATKLEDNCYFQMFIGCRSLQKVSSLPAAEMKTYCYGSMFSFCTSLEEAPDLPATTLASYCYSCMFWGCKNLKKAPVLPAIELEYCCYTQLFQDCEQINSIKMLGIGGDLYSGCSNWTTNVSHSGTFIKNSKADWAHEGIIPSGWTVLTADN